jgi:hypothetical protein
MSKTFIMLSNTTQKSYPSSLKKSEINKSEIRDKFVHQKKTIIADGLFVLRRFPLVQGGEIIARVLVIG